MRKRANGRRWLIGLTQRGNWWSAESIRTATQTSSQRNGSRKGHRIGSCDPLRLPSAPSPVDEYLVQRLLLRPRAPSSFKGRSPAVQDASDTDATEVEVSKRR